MMGCSMCRQGCQRLGKSFGQVKYSRVEAHGHWLILGWGVRDLSFGRVGNE